ncbi:hypothetical protein [Streptomyces showdoensis]|uniref:Prenyltransferase n=1 Tax=Streptomyces showdoensis TaxID=68268 RepID=A0A2P2GSP2_STREW|nr:hypothetical protein [Streptomyces showdoensis]KKZ74516.1 hypothetical protein VO63_07085 [Streptomyces showdoensis]
MPQSPSDRADRPPGRRPTQPELLRHSAVRWLARHLLDRREGGVHRAAPAAGGSPLTGDKHLADQSAAVLALADNAPDELPIALQGLEALLDRDGRPGFAEVADRSWQVRPEGRARTLRHQFHAATALLVGSRHTADPIARVRAVDLLNRCLSTCRDGAFPGALSEDWKRTHDDTPSPLTAAAALRALAIADALGESDVDTEQLPHMANALGRVAHELPTPGGEPRIALALAHAARLLDSAEHADTAHRTMALTVRHFTSREAGVGISGGDAGHLLLAGAVLRSRGHDDCGATAVSRAAIDRLADRRHGGFHTVPGQAGDASAVKYAQVQSVLAGALCAASALYPSHQGRPVGDARDADE